jgi:hypothetical protein
MAGSALRLQFPPEPAGFVVSAAHPLLGPVRPAPRPLQCAKPPGVTVRLRLFQPFRVHLRYYYIVERVHDETTHLVLNF